MENRFTLKDFILFVLIGIFIIMAWLAMVQFDRQWDDVKQISSQVQQIEAEQTRVGDRVIGIDQKINSLNEQIKLLEAINKQLQQGVVINNAGKTPQNIPDTTITEEVDKNLFNTELFAPMAEVMKEEDYARGDWLIDSFPAKISILSPLIYKDYYATLVHEQVFEPLLRPDLRTGKVIPILAESWEVEDNSDAYKEFEAKVKPELQEQVNNPATYADDLKAALEAFGGEDNQPKKGTSEYDRLVKRVQTKWVENALVEHPDRPTPVTVTFKLRKGLRFSDGHPLTSEDVVFTFEFMNNPKVDCPVPRQFYDNIESATANGPHEVTFKFKTPHYAALSFAGWRDVIPKHFYGKYVGNEEEFNKNPGLVLGSGPFRMKAPNGWRTGEPIELYRNERYWGPKPALEKILWKQIDDDNTRFLQFKNGELDFLISTPEQFDSVKEDQSLVDKAHMFSFVRVPSGYRYIAWNQERKVEGKETTKTLFSDKRIRQAMTYLTPRQRVCEDILKGYAVPAIGPWLKSSPQSDPNIDLREFNPQKGMQILKSLGWADTDGDGILDKDGQRFEFRMTYSSGSKTLESIVFLLKDVYGEYGILMKLNSLDWLQLMPKVENRDFDAALLGWGGGAVESDIRQMFHSSQIGNSADNYMSYSNPVLDKLIDEARTTINYEKRMKLWQACHRILYEDQPYTFFFVPQRLVMVNKRFKNVKHLYMNLNSKWEWYVPKQLQQYTN